jgi:hypothetical protein
MKLEVRTVTLDAIDYVLEHLSRADRAEMLAAGLQDPPEVFALAAREAAQAGAVYADGEPVALFGVNAMLGEPDRGIVWMIATDKFAESGVAGAVLSRQVVGQMRARFAVLSNWVHAEHRRAIRWLKWLGFHVKPEPVGPNGAFLEFEIEGVHV